MAKDEVSFDECWMVWFREGLDPGGKWYAWERSASMWRRDAIKWVEKNTICKINGWRNLRRRGVVKCVRTTLSTASPLEIAREADDG